jgi:hypothetical protein
MIIGRRTFVRNTALVGAASAIANLLSLSSIVISRAALLPGSSSPQLDAGGTDMNSVVFKIDGWNRRDGIAIDGSTTSSSDPTTNVSPGDRVWISINQSWRTAWR